MSKKTLRSLGKPTERTARKHAHTVNETTVRLMHGLSDVPALQVINVLSEMLIDATDPSIRTAILDARVQVLRARTSASNAGRDVKHDTTLSDLFSDKFPKMQLRWSAHDADDIIDDLEEHNSEHSDEMVQMLLLEKYTHQGFELPIGAILAAPKEVAEQLFATGVSELYTPEPAPQSEGDDTEVASRVLDGTETRDAAVDEIATE